MRTLRRCRCDRCVSGDTQVGRERSLVGWRHGGPLCFPETRRCAGLVLWAAYSASTGDLSAHSIVATSIYRTRDGLATDDKINASRSLYRLSTRYSLGAKHRLAVPSQVGYNR
jgi:hypothetical protein